MADESAGNSAGAVATTVEAVAGKREIGDRAVWSLSSCKQGFGVNQLRDGETTSYWQCVNPQHISFLVWRASFTLFS
jgi:anaphase-promoting complex subunit 10